MAAKNPNMCVMTSVGSSHQRSMGAMRGRRAFFFGAINLCTWWGLEKLKGGIISAHVCFVPDVLSASTVTSNLP